MRWFTPLAAGTKENLNVLITQQMMCYLQVKPLWFQQEFWRLVAETTLSVGLVSADLQLTLDGLGLGAQWMLWWKQNKSWWTDRRLSWYLQVCVDRIFVGYRRNLQLKANGPTSLLLRYHPTLWVQSVAGDLIKHLPRDDLDSGDDVEPAATVAVSYAKLRWNVWPIMSLYPLMRRCSLCSLCLSGSLETKQNQSASLAPGQGRRRRVWLKPEIKTPKRNPNDPFDVPACLEYGGTDPLRRRRF